MKRIIQSLLTIALFLAGTTSLGFSQDSIVFSHVHSEAADYVGTARVTISQFQADGEGERHWDAGLVSFFGSGVVRHDIGPLDGMDYGKGAWIVLTHVAPGGSGGGSRFYAADDAARASKRVRFSRPDAYGNRTLRISRLLMVKPPVYASFEVNGGLASSFPMTLYVSASSRFRGTSFDSITITGNGDPVQIYSWEPTKFAGFLLGDIHNNVVLDGQIGRGSKKAVDVSHIGFARIDLGTIEVRDISGFFMIPAGSNRALRSEDQSSKLAIRVRNSAVRNEFGCHYFEEPGIACPNGLAAGEYIVEVWRRDDLEGPPPYSPTHIGSLTVTGNATVAYEIP